MPRHQVGLLSSFSCPMAAAPKMTFPPAAPPAAVKPSQVVGRRIGIKRLMWEQADGGASGLFKPPSKRHARGQDPQGDSRLTSSRRNLGAAASSATWDRKRGSAADFR